MKFRRLLGMAALAGFLGMGSASAQWVWNEDFDSYSTGGLVGQSSWQAWTGCFGCDMQVVNTDKFTPPNCAFGIGDDDIIHFVEDAPGSGIMPTSGRWVMSCNTYVPSGSSGDGFFIMLNQYPSNLNWSVQVQFDTANNRVIDNLGGSRQLVYDQWVPVVIFIDLEADLHSIFYNGAKLTLNKSWSNSFSGAGSVQIAVVDLYCGSGFSGMFYDDVKLEKASDAPLILNVTPKTPAAGATLNYFAHGFGSMASGDPGLLYSWTVNRGFLMRRLLKFSFATEATWSFSTTVPAGLSGIELGQKVYGVPLAGGKVLNSQEDVVIFQ